MARGKGILAKGTNVHWNMDNDRKLLLQIIDRCPKNYDTAKLAGMFPGATRKAIEERIAKLKREAKSAADPSGASVITPRKRKNSAEGEYGDEGLPTPKRKTIETLDQQAEEGLSLPNRAESPVTGSLYPLPERGESDIESGLSDIDSVIFCAERAISGKTSSEEQDEREW